VLHRAAVLDAQRRREHRLVADARELQPVVASGQVARWKRPFALVIA
jgi:hypothetical protein